MKSFDVLKNAELVRQAVLDHLIANPGALQPDIQIALERENDRSFRCRLFDMAASGEITREPAIYTKRNKHGYEQQQRTYKCYAAVTKTKSAEAMYSNIPNHGAPPKQYNDNDDGWVEPPEVPGITRNVNPNRPVKNKGQTGGQCLAGPRSMTPLEGVF